MSTAARMMGQEVLHWAGGAGGSAYKVGSRVCRQVYLVGRRGLAIGSGDSEAVDEGR